MRRRPIPVTQLPVHDALVASAFGHTEATWLALTDQERAWHRTNHTKADGFRG